MPARVGDDNNSCLFIPSGALVESIKGGERSEEKCSEVREYQGSHCDQGHRCTHTFVSGPDAVDKVKKHFLE